MEDFVVTFLFSFGPVMLQWQIWGFAALGISIDPSFLADEVANARSAGNDHVRCQTKKQPVLDDPRPCRQSNSQLSRAGNGAEVAIQDHIS
jgi:hypothetical protein